MKKRRNKKLDEFSSQKLGNKLNELIRAKGYTSAYDFWVNSPVDLEIARSTLNSLLSGKFDVRVSTLAKIAKALEVDLSELFQALEDAP